MITISLCMIVREEEYTMKRCLDSVRDTVDEIIIVDTGSTDGTKEVARLYTPHVYDFEWIDDFSAARNYSFSKASMDYILWLDADDVLAETGRNKFHQLKQSLDPSIDMLMMKYYLGIDGHGVPLCTCTRERLLKRAKGYRWQGYVHEYIPADGKIAYADIAITHLKAKPHSDRNLNIYEKILSQGAALSGRDLYYYAMELCDNARYGDAIGPFTRFLDTDTAPSFYYARASLGLYTCHKQKNDMKSAFSALIRSFEHGAPRAEVCCQIGYYYKGLRQYPMAIHWFNIATKIAMPPQSPSPIIHDCYGYIPYMEMSSCCYRMGKIREAVKYNDKAGACKPYDGLFRHNKEFLGSLSVDAPRDCLRQDPFISFSG